MTTKQSSSQRSSDRDVADEYLRETGASEDEPIQGRRFMLLLIRTVGERSMLPRAIDNGVTFHD
jgi:hypothetical protein